MAKRNRKPGPLRYMRTGESRDGSYGYLCLSCRFGFTADYDLWGWKFCPGCGQEWLGEHIRDQTRADLKYEAERLADERLESTAKQAPRWFIRRFRLRPSGGESMQ
jgi:hypothetical protein